MTSIKKITHYMVLAIATGQLAACQTTTSGSDAASIAASKQDRMNAAIERTAIATSPNASLTAAIITSEKKYKRNSTSPEAALEYARNLRRANVLDRAALILTPFATPDDAFAGVKAEMSTIALGLGNYNSAENHAKEAVIQDPTDYQAYQNLGIALDAKEMHPEAERAFRKGLENWRGNPTTIMNNLALNLATQGFIEEAIEVLERAKALSPNRIEIERNLRIIRTLNER